MYSKDFPVSLDIIEVAIVLLSEKLFGEIFAHVKVEVGVGQQVNCTQVSGVLVEHAVDDIYSILDPGNAPIILLCE